MPKIRVLVADDDIFFLKVVADILAGADCEVRTVRGGEAALEQVPEFEPHVVMLDVVMPDLMGIDVSRQLRQAKPTRTLPILLVSTGIAEFDHEGGDPRRYLADDYLHKPFKPEQLISRIRRLAQLGRERLRRRRHPTQEIKPWTERRQHPRVPLDVEVTAQIGGSLIFRPTLNIGQGGLCLEPERLLEPGSEIELRLTLPDGCGLIAAAGHVVWFQEREYIGQFGAGVSFSRVREGDDERLARYVGEMLKVVNPDGKEPSEDE